MRAICIVVMALGMVGCQHGDDGGGGDDTGGPRAFEVDRADLVPFAIVTLADDQATFADDAYAAELDGAAISLYRVDATHLQLLIPDVEPGALTLTTSIDGIDYQPLVLDVTAAGIADPDAVIDAAVTSWAAALDALHADGDPSITGYLALADAARDRALAAIDDASAADRLVLAELLDANPGLAQIILPPPNGAWSWAFKTDLRKLAAQGAAAVVTALVITTAVTAVATTGTVVVAAVATYAFMEEAAAFGRTLGDAYEHRVSESEEQMFAAGGTAVVDFEPNEPKTVLFYEDVHPFGPIDLLSADVDLAAAAAQTARMIEVWTSLGPLGPEVGNPPPFTDGARVARVIPSLVDTDPASVVALHTWMEGHVQQATGALGLSFDGTEIEDFTFEVTYTDELDRDVTLTVNARLQCGTDGVGCCSGATSCLFTSTLECATVPGRTTPICRTCGTPGEDCCTTMTACGANNYCAPDDTCEPCGAYAQVCCTGGTCMASGDYCSNGFCTHD